MNEELLTLLVVVVLGLVFGRLNWCGWTLGPTSVLLVAFGAGHFGFSVPRVAGTLGSVLFIYCVGLSAGPRLLAGGGRHHQTALKVAVTVVVVALAVARLLAYLLDVPSALLAGIFAGSLTSPPALAALLDCASANAQSLITVGYGVGYLVGLLVVLTFVQVLPRLAAPALPARELPEDEPYRVVRVQLRVTNPNLVGKEIKAAADGLLMAISFHVSRIFDGRRLVPVEPGTCFEAGQILQLVGEVRHLERAISLIGEQVELPIADNALCDRERSQVVLTSSKFVGSSLRQLRIFSRYGVTITRIVRHGVTIVPASDTLLEPADQLTVVGSPERLKCFAKAVGHRERALYETDLLSLFSGITLGVLLGILPLGIGSSNTTLGLVVGTLSVALLLGHFGHIGKLVGRMPLAAQDLLRELGLLLFLAEAGVRAGGAFYPLVAELGVSMLLAALVIALAAVAAGLVSAFWLLKLDFLIGLGAVCGSLTSAAALSALRAQVAESEDSLSAYAAAYPLALVAVLVVVRILLWAS